MKETMINLIKSACKDDSKLKELDNIYMLYDQLQYSESLEEMAQSLYDWLNIKYKVMNLNFSLFDMEYNTTTEILKSGGDFFLDGELSFYFVINTHTEVNAVVSFAASSQDHYDEIISKNSFLEAAFFQISPMIQNGIMKRVHIVSLSIDSVTNVHNRKYMIKHIYKMMALSKHDCEHVTFLMVGVDHFKAVIEEFDYDIGDLVLVELAKVIHSNIKEFDIVARLTGDEFLVALVNLPEPNVATFVAQKIIDTFAKSKITVDEETGQILQKTVCVGISSYPKDSDDINQVLKYADNFLYEAKNHGRGSYSVYNKVEESSIELF